MNFYHGNILASNDLYGININGLTERYVSVKNTNLKKLADKLGIENSSAIPNSIIKIDVDSLNITENLNNIFPKYIEDFKNKFNKDLFVKEKKYKLILESNEYICNRYTLTTTINDFYNFAKEEALKMKSDDSLKNFVLEKFGITNAVLEENMDNLITKCDELIASSKSNTVFKIHIYELDGNTLKLEANTDNITYEFYVYKTEDYTKLLYYYNNIELVTRKTIETQKFILENEYKADSMDLTINLTSKAKNENKTDGNMAEYNESDYKVLYGIHNVTENSADRTFSLILNNKRVLDYKSKITIGVNAEIETISSENSDVINDMSESDLRNLISVLTENAAGFIDISSYMEEEEEIETLIDTSTLDSAFKDLNSGFLNIEAAYNIDQEGEDSLYNYFNQERLLGALNFGNEVLLSNEKDTILYRNKANQTFKFTLKIVSSKIEIIDYTELMNVSEISLEDILYPPEPEPEIVEVDEQINNDTLSVMKSEIDSYLAAVYNEAVTTGEELYAADFINENQLVLNCSTIEEAYVEEQDGGRFYIECKDQEGNIYSGIIEIAEDGLNLLMFN